MALLVVPYNSAMRLGQGFNSYTQTLGLSQAVTFGAPDQPRDLQPPDVAKIPQIVTYSSHFVDKLSDVVKALNVSAALSVKVGTVTGSGSGGYIDEDKIKESEINFIVQVKVTNQTTTPIGEPQFNPTADMGQLDTAKFTDLYGDTFISGFLEGGEFVGVVSIKVRDSTKIQNIKAELEVAFSAVQAKGSGSYNASDMAKDSETSISVNWSGGGQLKDPNAKWDLETMLRVAAEFPDLCALCPQRTTAILTKYTNLTTFHTAAGHLKPVSYDNVGIYTSDLLDDYMDYKVHWKNVRLMHDDLEAYEKSKAQHAYDATIEGLDKARREILKNMVHIVREVDEVRANPNLASEAILGDKKVYLNPVIFAARLPIRSVVSHAVLGSDKAATHVDPAKLEPLPWQWAVIRSKDSTGHDIGNFGNGTLSPEDMMKKCYAWEAENPGKHIRGFNTMGYAKDQLSKTAQLVDKGTGVDLYVRVLIDDTWAFIPNNDAVGNDITVPDFKTVDNDEGDIDIVGSLEQASARPDIVSFNSYGWTKKAVELPTVPHQSFTGKPHQGIWIRKSILQV